jgi:tetratricopeptide (TPR) repeat protein
MATSDKDPPPGEPPSPARAIELERAGRYAEAEDAFTVYVAAHPNDARALAGAGNAAFNAGRIGIAVKRFEQLAALQPESAEARSALGFALIRAGKPVDAVFHLERAVRLDPRHAGAHHRLGVALERAGDRVNALRSFERALALDPANADAAASLGHAHNRRGETDAARAAFARALASDPRHVDARTGAAFADAVDGDLEGARAKLEAMAREQPQGAAFWLALGKLRAWSGALEPAEHAYREAAARDPADVDARFGIAAALLGRGRFAEGLRALEDRPGGRFGESPRFARLPVWSGAPQNAPLLVHCEGSLSDTIQFARFLPDVRARVSELVLLADGHWLPLAPLFAGAAGVDRVITDEAQLDTLRTPPRSRAGIQSLPFHLGLVHGLLPARVPYLSAPPERLATWRARLSGTAAKRVGLVWSARGDRAALSIHKSVPPQTLAPLFATPGIAFASLDAAAVGSHANLGALAAHVADFAQDIRDFGDTAAIIAALDLVIAVDSPAAHLAGAMNRPVWLLDRFHTSWRWRASDRHSAWYPSLVIFRQERFLDWRRPIADAAAALAAFAADGTLPS